LQNIAPPVIRQNRAGIKRAGARRFDAAVPGMRSGV
jgi:hypothetical protein